MCTLWLLLLDGGFTLCVSAAVKTTGWTHAQHVRRSRELADGELLMVANGTQALYKLGLGRDAT